MRRGSKKGGKSIRKPMGLRVLITHPFLFEINGATCVALELAQYLQKRGDTVTVYTNIFADPIKQYFINNNIHVDEARSNPEYNLEDFDIIWINSQTFPVSLLKKLGNIKKNNHLPKFIFMHMSAHEYCADEMPYIYHFEEELSSLSLFVSEEALEFNKKYFDKLPPIDFYRNPAPENYLIDRMPSREPRNVLVVSNHPCNELFGIKALLDRVGIKTDYLGYMGDKYELMSERILARYDLIITIGKTVQYCLVSGTPVYIYGSFGGPGYLDDDNFNKAKINNFSGRGFYAKTPEEIVKDILENYIKATEYYSKNMKTFRKEYLIVDNISRIFRKVQRMKPKDIKLTKANIAATSSLLYLIMTNFEYRYDRLVKEQLAKENALLKSENKKLKTIVKSRSVRLWLKINTFKFRLFTKKKDS